MAAQTSFSAASICIFHSPDKSSGLRQADSGPKASVHPHPYFKYSKELLLLVLITYSATTLLKTTMTLQPASKKIQKTNREYCNNLLCTINLIARGKIDIYFTTKRIAERDVCCPQRQWWMIALLLSMWSIFERVLEKDEVSFFTTDSVKNGWQKFSLQSIGQWAVKLNRH